VREGKIAYPICGIVEPFEERKRIAGNASEEAASKEAIP
jgi:hypothetical protein